jgi:hypothetical protein
LQQQQQLQQQEIYQGAKGHKECGFCGMANPDHSGGDCEYAPLWAKAARAERRAKAATGQGGTVPGPIRSLCATCSRITYCYPNGICEQCTVKVLQHETSPHARRPGPPPGCCRRFPICNCVKARWDQGCARCGFALTPGHCIFHTGVGWAHSQCALQSATYMEHPPAGPVPTARWTEEGIWAVWDETYAQRGIYMTPLQLRSHLKPDQTFPPAREDGRMAQVFDSLDSAVENFFVRVPRAQRVEVWR